LRVSIRFPKRITEVWHHQRPGQDRMDNPLDIHRLAGFFRSLSQEIIPFSLDLRLIVQNDAQ
jgi:hypothetical protein